jgi:TP901-1 family phage major tail protein
LRWIFISVKKGKTKMKKFNLQMFGSTAVSGKKIVYLFRVLDEAANKAGATLAFTTENTRTKSKDADTTVTKDGTIRTPGAAEVEITATALLAQGDTLIDELETAMDENKLIEVWEANLDEETTEGTGKFKGAYYQGYLTEFEKTSNAEDFVECSLTFGINGDGVKGDVTVTAEQQEIANYVFTDTNKTGA